MRLTWRNLKLAECSISRTGSDEEKKKFDLVVARCRQFDAILGELKFPANFSLDNTVAFPGPSAHDQVKMLQNFLRP